MEGEQAEIPVAKSVATSHIEDSEVDFVTIGNELIPTMQFNNVMVFCPTRALTASP